MPFIIYSLQNSAQSLEYYSIVYYFFLLLDQQKEG